MARRFRWLALVLLPLVVGCGFHPVYGPAADGGASPAAQALAAISVGLIPERSGQLLRLALQERFERSGVAAAHRYDLNVSFSIGVEQLSIQQNSTATWSRVVGTAVYRLVSQDPSRATVTSGSVRSVDGFNMFDQQYFAADMENEAVQRRVAQAVADQIALKLAAFFAHRSDGGGTG